MRYAYLAGSLLFIAGSLLLLATARDWAQAIPCLVYIAGSLSFLAGTIHTMRDK